MKKTVAILITAAMVAIGYSTFADITPQQEQDMVNNFQSTNTQSLFNNLIINRPKIGSTSGRAKARVIIFYDYSCAFACTSVAYLWPKIWAEYANQPVEFDFFNCFYFSDDHWRVTDAAGETELNLWNKYPNCNIFMTYMTSMYGFPNWTESWDIVNIKNALDIVANKYNLPIKNVEALEPDTSNIPDINQRLKDNYDLLLDIEQSAGCTGGPLTVIAPYDISTANLSNTDVIVGLAETPVIIDNVVSYPQTTSRIEADLAINGVYPSFSSF